MFDQQGSLLSKKVKLKHLCKKRLIFVGKNVYIKRFFIHIKLKILDLYAID